MPASNAPSPPTTWPESHLHRNCFLATIKFTIVEANGPLQSAEVEAGLCIVGRNPAANLSLPHADVSWRHARLTLGAEDFLIEDLDSTCGTWLNDEQLVRPIRLRYPQQLRFASVRVLVENMTMPSTCPVSAADDESLITKYVDATDRSRVPVRGATETSGARLALLYDLPLQFAAQRTLPDLCGLILRGVMDLIPGARRGALLTLDPPTGKLALRASVPAGNAPLSRTLVRRAAAKLEGFIWTDEPGMESAASIKELKIRSGMYAALPWDGQPVGVLCVDNPEASAAFGDEDLRFMVAVANYAAAAVANHLLQDDLQATNRTMGHLLTNFSPKLRELLVAKARQGRLQLGGKKSEVTILMCDLRGFTRTSAELACGDVVAMLNDYFSVLGDIIFEHDGTIDKFIGDAILAVFGSPEPDPEHASKAVQAALAMVEAVATINARRAAAELPRCGAGVGVQTGEVLHGFIGNAERMEFTVIGDAVNRAARYCAAAGAGEILLGPATWAYVKHAMTASPRTVATKHEGDTEVWIVDRTAANGPAAPELGSGPDQSGPPS